MTARAVLGLLAPRGARLIAGETGLDRAVTRVSVMRARSPAFEPLRGGELAVISLATLRAARASDESLTLGRLIQELSGQGVAALVVTSPPTPPPPRRGDPEAAAPGTAPPEGVHPYAPTQWQEGAADAVPTVRAEGARGAVPTALEGAPAPLTEEELALATTLTLPVLVLPWGMAAGEIEREVSGLIAARRAAGAVERDTPRVVYDALVRGSLRGEDARTLG
ncbi:MAG TPA: PucR family transcriptional regulator ligand-binding domain-containing protein, partial [Ktedonobacterales bacterium]